MTCSQPSLLTSALPCPRSVAPLSPMWSEWASQACETGASVARLPFDAARAQYAHAVRIGWIRPSMLASRDLEVTLNALEQLTLGPWARQV